MGQFLFKTLIVVVAVYLAVGLLLFVRQGSYIYFPAHMVRQTPASLGLTYETLSLTADDGVAIAAWYVQAQPDPATMARPVVLFCHGNAGNIGDRLTTIQTFVALGMDVLIFDYHGYGQSGGQPGEEETYRAALAAWQHLTYERHIPPQRIVLFGRSLGGAVAAWLATQHEPGLLVLESAFESVPAMARALYPIYPVRLLSRFSYDTLARMPAIHSPVIIAHSRDDEMIPFGQGQRLFAAANEPKAFVDLQGSHNAGGIDISPGYRALLKTWVETHVGVSNVKESTAPQTATVSEP